MGSPPGFQDPSIIDTSLDSRAVTFENPRGERGAGGQTHGGRKGSPARQIRPGERLVLADLEGPGTLRHFWMTFPPAPPEVMRALALEVFYDGNAEPSISVPCLDFFGLPQGRPVAYASALTAAQEGRGFNAFFPMPFRRAVRVEVTNHSQHPMHLFFQIDYTLEPELSEQSGYLHVPFRRENPTVQQRDFVMVEGLRGPGRFLGCCIGIRVIDAGTWYGEGEVKVYRDGDDAYPTICGTGLEDYVGSAWGMGPHHAPFGGAPLDVRGPDAGPNPDFLSFYRWHVPDPIIFQREMRVTIQQIGYAVFRAGEDETFERYSRSNPPAGTGWTENPSPRIRAMGIAERVDDYSAAAFVYCREPQAVTPLDVKGALVDIERRDYEDRLRSERRLPGATAS